MPTQQFNVEITCEGCSKAVERVLSKLSDIENVDIDLAKKLVVITSKLPVEELLDNLKKTGKEVSYLGELK